MADVDLTPAERLAGVLTAAATAVVITAIAIVPFLSPAWVSFEQGRANATGWTGYTTAELGAATDAILADLVIGPPDFDVEVRGEPVLNERERSHMRDVRGVFAGFAGVALLAAAGLLVGFALARRRGHPERAWRAVRNGAVGLAFGVVIGGVIALVAFDAAFEVFHRLFFSGGTYTFDPGTERLVQLFPFTFWSETSMAVGTVILVLSIGVAVIAGRRLRNRAASAATATPAVPAAEATR
jgi:integral membrane protein (TIGR01906 family)